MRRYEEILYGIKESMIAIMAQRSRGTMRVKAHIAPRRQSIHFPSLCSTPSAIPPPKLSLFFHARKLDINTNPRETFELVFEADLLLAHPLVHLQQRVGALGLEEDGDGVELRHVQPLDGVRRDVQDTVLHLGRGEGFGRWRG